MLCLEDSDPNTLMLLPRTAGVTVEDLLLVQDFSLSFQGQELLFVASQQRVQTNINLTTLFLLLCVLYNLCLAVYLSPSKSREAVYKNGCNYYIVDLTWM